MKKILSAVLVCLMLFSTTFMVTASAAKLGDVNGDSNVNSSDALLVLKHSVGSAKLDSDKQKKADVNGDGNINSSDALIILKISVGSYEGDLDDGDDDTALAPHEIIIEYVLENGSHEAGSEYYYITHSDSYENQRWTTFVFYNTEDKELSFTRQHYNSSGSSTAVTNMYLFYSPGSATQEIAYQADFDSAPDVTAMGYISTSSFAPDGGAITNFSCSNNSLATEIKNLTETGITLLLFGVQELLDDIDIGVTLYDLGFTKWSFNDDSGNDDSGNDDSGNNNDDVVAVTPQDKLANYIVKNGYYDAQDNIYIISRSTNYNNGGKSTALIFYDASKDELSFMQQVVTSKGVTSYTYLFYVPGAARQAVVYEAELTSTKTMVGTGTISTSSFSSSNNYIYDFTCSDSGYYSDLKSLTASGTSLMLTEVNILLRSTGLGITLYDLGFTSWS